LAMESLAITAGSLTVGAASELDAGFTLSNATLVVNGVLTLAGNSQITSGTVLGSASLNNAGTMTLSGTGDVLALGAVLNDAATSGRSCGARNFVVFGVHLAAVGMPNNSAIYH